MNDLGGSWSLMADWGLPVGYSQNSLIQDMDHLKVMDSLPESFVKVVII